MIVTPAFAVESITDTVSILADRAASVSSCKPGVARVLMHRIGRLGTEPAHGEPVCGYSLLAELRIFYRCTMDLSAESFDTPPSNSPKLVLVCGLPGSGKTTMARMLESALPAVRLCPDEWLTDLEIDLWDDGVRDRLEKRFWHLAQDLLRLGQNVILESGFWLRSDREEKRLAGQAIGANVEIIVLDAELDELVRRLDRRKAEQPVGAVIITRDQLEQMIPFFDRPSDDELELFDAATVHAGNGLWVEL